MGVTPLPQQPAPHRCVGGAARRCVHLALRGCALW